MNTDIVEAIAGRHANLSGIIRANCPRCEDRVHKTDRRACLSVNVQSGWFKCYRCETYGRLGDDELPFDTRTVATQGTTESPVINLPPGFIPLWLPEGQAISLAPARRYLASRVGVTAEIIQAARIGACIHGKFKHRVVVPIYKSGRLAGYVGRLWHKRVPHTALTYRYSEGFSRASTLYNEEALYKTTEKPAIVVEGVFDTFPFWPHGVAVLGKPSPAQKEMLLQARRPMLVVFDGDAHREATALVMSLRLRKRRAAALRLPPGVDPDEVHEFVKRRAREAFATPKEIAS